VRTIPLVGKNGGGRVVLVDDEVYDKVSGYRWFANQRPARPGRRAMGPYAVTNLGSGDLRVTIYMHKHLTGWPRTDHRDHNGLNNQRSNLREATHAENMRNRLPASGHSSRFKGVYWDKGTLKWRAYIEIDGVRRQLGRFVIETDAARAYDEAALSAWGEFAWLNLPGPGQGGEYASLADPRLLRTDRGE
jgi:hypothetical protein